MQNYIRFSIIAATIGSLSITYLAGLSNSNHAMACECLEPKSPTEELTQSKAVFSGKVTEIRTDQFGKTVTLYVERVWKGVSNNTIIAVTSLDTGGCGFPFEENHDYLVYADGGTSETSFDVSSCSRTAPIEVAQADLASLGTGYLPIQNSDGGPALEVDYSGYRVPVVVGIGAGIAGIIAFLTLRKRR